MPDTTTDLDALTAQVKVLSGDLNRLLRSSATSSERRKVPLNRAAGERDSRVAAQRRFQAACTSVDSTDSTPISGTTVLRLVNIHPGPPLPGVPIEELELTVLHSFFD